MDFMDRSPVERIAQTIWLEKRRPSPADPMGRERRLTQALAGLSRPPQRRQEDSLERVLRRRHVCGGEKRGQCVGKTKRGKGTKLMVLADGTGTPLGVCVEKESPSEVKLLVPTLDSVQIKGRHGKPSRPTKPQRLIADRGYDSNAVRALLVKRQIEPLIPCSKNNTVATHQDGRKLRRYKRRWLIERT